MRFRSILLIVTIILFVAACSMPEPVAETTGEVNVIPSSELQEISVAGSTTVLPLAEKLAEGWTAKTGVKIDIAGGGSSAGVKAAGDGTADIGNASREVKDSEKETYPNILIFPIALDGIAIVVHPEVNVDALRLEEVRAIFSGEVTDWGEITDSYAGPITVVSREEGSGTRGAFEELVMGEDGPPITDRAIFRDANDKVRAAVSSTPDSIGYLSFGYLDDSVVAVAIDGVEATVEAVLSGDYGVVRPLNMITNGEPEGIVKAWLDWILSEQGQVIVVEQGYIAVQ